ncbi:hypothetical protein P22_1157 [Propionispora sp. 2/2-37]|uniref:cephalosporin hydroxylase family protein n=1 Tax=Propionispora sp. 2/2-37 TaxID=1677858 RepID=UPI0006BB8B8B|nr:CmcI family methyltransferase [Propionispora sp. 2/2-37]CUH95088.1 hypothetical protein P22_1157 [Propionispora sp. 2/2-37]
MKITIDTDQNSLCCQDQVAGERKIPLYSPEAFYLLSEWWIKIGWNEKYAYTFSWLGRPIIQLPADMFRMQEILYRIQPDVIIETGVAHGGSVIFYAGLCKVSGIGRVIGIDIEIRPRNREAIENHPLASYITLFEGNSTARELLAKVKDCVKESDRVLVVLDSCHTKQHVRSELEAYAPLVSPGSYIVATDGIMKEIFAVPRGMANWQWDNPCTAVREFLQDHPEFVLEEPEWNFNESQLVRDVTFWPNAWLKKRS